MKSSKTQSVGVVLTALALMVLGAFLARMLVRANISSARTVSAAHLGAIGRSLMIYGTKNNGDLQTLVAETDLSPDTLISPSDANAPSTNDGEELYSSYIFLSGFKKNTDPRMVLAYEREDINDGKGVNVLFVGGHVKWMSMPAFQKQLAITKAHLKQLVETDADTNNAAK